MRRPPSLYVPRTRTRLADRSFAVNGPAVWNWTSSRTRFWTHLYPFSWRPRTATPSDCCFRARYQCTYLLTYLLLARLFVDTDRWHSYQVSSLYYALGVIHKPIWLDFCPEFDANINICSGIFHFQPRQLRGLRANFLRRTTRTQGGHTYQISSRSTKPFPL